MNATEPTDRPVTRPAQTGALQRMLDRSGYDVDVVGARHSLFRDLYYLLMNTSWARLLGVYVGAFLAINLLFALLYFADPGALGGTNANVDSRFWRGFLFSVQTLVSIGVGDIAPRSVYGHGVAVVEALTGLILLALSTGLAYARFARPTARILFSDVATIAAIDGASTLSWRALNQRDNLILEAHARAYLLRSVPDAAGKLAWHLEDLDLVRPDAPVFALSWTLMHRIDAASPLHGLDAAAVAASRLEIMVVITGIDESMAQPIHARKVYEPADLRWNMRLVDIIAQPTGKRRILRYAHFHSVEPVEPT